MLRIRNEQMASLAAGMGNRLVFESAGLLRARESEWCRARTEEELHQFILDMVVFAHEHKIFAAKNIQALMLWQIERGFTVPLSGYRQFVLQRENFYEEYRMGQFYDAITYKVNLVKISLNADTES